MSQRTAKLLRRFRKLRLLVGESPEIADERIAFVRRVLPGPHKRRGHVLGRIRRFLDSSETSRAAARWRASVTP